MATSAVVVVLAVGVDTLTVADAVEAATTLDVDAVPCTAVPLLVPSRVTDVVVPVATLDLEPRGGFAGVPDPVGAGEVVLAPLELLGDGSDCVAMAGAALDVVGNDLVAEDARGDGTGVNGASSGSGRWDEASSCRDAEFAALAAVAATAAVAAVAAVAAAAAAAFLAFFAFFFAVAVSGAVESGSDEDETGAGTPTDPVVVDPCEGACGDDRAAPNVALTPNNAPSMRSVLEDDDDDESLSLSPQLLPLTRYDRPPRRTSGVLAAASAGGTPTVSLPIAAKMTLAAPSGMDSDTSSFTVKCGSASPTIS